MDEQLVQLLEKTVVVERILRAQGVMRHANTVQQAREKIVELVESNAHLRELVEAYSETPIENLRFTVVDPEVEPEVDEFEVDEEDLDEEDDE